MTTQIYTKETPLQKLECLGENYLSNLELLAIILGGNDKALDLATAVIKESEGNLIRLAKCPLGQLKRIDGIGLSRAGAIRAVITLSKRLQVASLDYHPKIVNPIDAAELLRAEMQLLDQEEFHLLLLDSRNRVMRRVQVAKGQSNSCGLSPMEIFRPAILHNSKHIILAHNHPTGDVAPTPQDIQTTIKIVAASEFLGIKISDHIIIGCPKSRGARWFSSMRELDLMPI